LTDAARDLRDRTRRYALQIIRLYGCLPQSAVAQVIGRQLLRSGTAPGAHYREATRAKSTADFISKMEGAAQELDETAYWLELLIETKLADPHTLDAASSETEELLAIFVAIVKKAKRPRSSIGLVPDPSVDL